MPLCTFLVQSLTICHTFLRVLLNMSVYLSSSLLFNIFVNLDVKNPYELAEYHLIGQSQYKFTSKIVYRL